MDEAWGTGELAKNPQEFAILVLYAIAAVSGGLGGATVAAHHLLIGKRQARSAYFAAYAVIGATFGLLVAAYGAFVLSPENYTDVIGPSVAAGAVGALVLSGANFTVGFILRRLGIEVEVNLRRQRNQNNDQGGGNDPRGY